MIESPGFCRASPAWTLSVENLRRPATLGRSAVPSSGSASSIASGLLICVVLIFHHTPRHDLVRWRFSALNSRITLERNKKPQRQTLGICGLLFRIVRTYVRLGGSETSTKLRDVGSLAVSAASGHKSQVLSILVCAAARHKSGRGGSEHFRKLAASPQSGPKTRVTDVRWSMAASTRAKSLWLKLNTRPGRFPLKLRIRIPRGGALIAIAGVWLAV